MAGRNYGTMNNGYYYDTGKSIGYDVRVSTMIFQDVAYHSKGQLIDQLVHNGYKREDIEVERVEI